MANLPIKRVIFFALILSVIYLASPKLFHTYLVVKEPFFIDPLPLKDGIAMRSDSMGNGEYGARRSGGRRKHKGVDLEGDVGEVVVASLSGFATTGEVKRGMGKYVKILHRDGYQTVYGHLLSVSAKNESWVWQGHEIGAVGKTGNANYKRMKPHVHFEIKKNEICEDPLPYLNKEVRVK
ncbi:M23 family metallopeptidase [Candidatus Omnitrophota bacterium]